RDLLDKKEVRPALDEVPVPRPIWTLRDERLVERFETPAETIYGVLVALLRERPFPFRRCAFKGCDRIFARDGKRKFCSLRCQEGHRNSAPKRKRDVQDAVKRWRKRTREARLRAQLERE